MDLTREIDRQEDRQSTPADQNMNCFVCVDAKMKTLKEVEAGHHGVAAQGLDGVARSET